MVTLIINLWAGASILRKDRNGVHILIVLDCLVNVVSAVTNSFLVQVGYYMLSSINPNSLLVQSPWSILASPTTCLISTSFLYILTCWNRLVPVQVVIKGKLSKFRNKTHGKLCRSLQFPIQDSLVFSCLGSRGSQWVKGASEVFQGAKGVSAVFQGASGRQGRHWGVHRVKGCVSGVPGGQGGRLGAPGVKGGFLGVPKDQRPHLMGPLMICKALKVISGSTWVMGHV